MTCPPCAQNTVDHPLFPAPDRPLIFMVSGTTSSPRAPRFAADQERQTLRGSRRARCGAGCSVRGAPSAGLSPALSPSRRSGSRTGRSRSPECPAAPWRRRWIPVFARSRISARGRWLLDRSAPSAREGVALSAALLPTGITGSDRRSAKPGSDGELAGLVELFHICSCPTNGAPALHPFYHR